MTESKHRNNGLDALKAIAAISVVFIHYNHVDGDIGEIYTRIICNITKFAVPFFFMVTGYFLIPIVEKHREKGYVKKILIMALCSSAFYFVFYLLDTSDRISWLQEHYRIGTIFTWLTGQDDPAGFHLWYLYCLVWSFIIVVTTYKYLSLKALYFLTSILVIYHFVGGGMFECYTISIPAMVLGMSIYKMRNKISNFSPKLIGICAFGMLILMTVEAYCQISEPGFYYEGHILALLVFMFVLCWTFPSNLTWLSYIGLEFSALIYILHVFVNNIVSRFVDYDSIMLQIIRPWLVFGVTLGLAMLCVYLSRLRLYYGASKNRA